MLLRTDNRSKTFETSGPKRSAYARRACALSAGVMAPMLALGLAPGSAVAQSAYYFDRNHNVGVLDRPRPDYQPLGIVVGPFTLSPSLNISPQYDSNIFAASTNVKSDLITTVQPGLSFSASWPRSSLNISLQSASNFYTQHSDQNTTNYSASVAGQWSIFSASQVSGGLTYSHTTEPRTDEGAIVTRTPVQYDTSGANLGAVETLNRLQLSEQALVQHYDYSQSSDTVFALSYLNGDFSAYTLKANYALNPEISAYVSGQYNRHDYAAPLSGMPERNSSGYDINVGTSFDLTRLMRGQIGFGYLSQTYVSPVYKPVNGPSVHINVDYFITDLTTLGVDVNRAVIDAEDPTAVSYVQTHGDLRADHELLRNLILSGNVGYETDTFTGYDRTDHRLNASLSGSYLLNRNISISATYTYLDESSTGVDRIGGYDVSVVSLGLNLHL